MKSRIQCAAFVLTCVLLLTGCWDYLGMEEINIVAGIAIDQGSDGGYEATLELVNIAAGSEGSNKDSLIVSAEGPSIFEALRNAKKTLYNDLYLGSMRTVIISEELARNQGLLNVIDGFIRNTQIRETIVLVVSQEESAKKLLSAKGLDSSNISYEIAKIVADDQKAESCSREIQLYEALNYIQAKGLELVLPAFHLVENNEEAVVESNGVAIFKDDKFISYLSPEETRYFLMATDPGGRGSLSFTMPDTEELVALRITKCTNKPEIRYAGGRVSVFVTVEIDYRIIEMSGVFDPFPDDTLMEVNRQVELVLAERITEVFYRTQADPGLDIYGYGNLIYENQYPLWQDIRDRWEKLYREADFSVEVKAANVNVGSTF